MFCNNCGSKLPTGAKFCNACGTKVEAEAEKKTSYVDNMSFSREAAPRRTPKPTSNVSFDWSGVVDESHKREIPRVKSPWGNTGLDEEESARTERVVSSRPSTRYTDDDLFEDISQPSKDPGRTMSFIDVLKAEREEKMQAASRAAEPVTQRRRTADDYSAFDHADGFAFENEILPKRDREMTQGYTDMNLDIVKDIDREPVARPKRYATPIDEQDDIASSYLDEAPSFDKAFINDDEDDFDEPVPARRGRAYATPIDEVEEVRKAPAAGTVAEPKKEAKVEDLYADEPSTQDLDAELAAILGGTTVAAAASAPVEAPVAEEPAVEPKNDETEVEALKRRLAELMGETNEEPTPVAAHETPSVEELFADEPAEVADFEKPGFVPPETAPVSEAPSDGADVFAMFDDDSAAGSKETDAMSIDDLEKDLFGNELGEDAEAEATKKIDKFYTLYKKNEEFQKLLDEEYNKLQSEEGEGQANDLEALMAQQLAAQQMQQQQQMQEQQMQQQQMIQQQMQQQQMQQQQMQQQQMQQFAPQPVQQQPVQQFVAPVEEERPLSKKELKAQKKAAKKAAKPVRDDDEESGGNALTIIAVVIAVLLVILLAVILILNFAPDSGLGLKLDSMIQNITSHFSALEGIKDEFLL